MVLVDCLPVDRVVSAVAIVVEVTTWVTVLVNIDVEVRERMVVVELVGKREVTRVVAVTDVGGAVETAVIVV